MGLLDYLDYTKYDTSKTGGSSAYLQSVHQVNNVQNKNNKTGAALAQLYTLEAMNPEQAKDMWTAFRYQQSNPSSAYYNAYAQPTNKAVSELGSYGIDVSNINDDWFKQNNYLTQYLKYDGTSNTPTKPGKKASTEEKAAYAYYQVWKSEDATKRAEQQWNDLQKDIFYWTNRTDRNYSNEEIMNKIDWSKYGELTSMDKNASMQPNEYNRAIGYSKDAMDAVIWAARNPGYQGGLEGAMAASYLGEGNQWQYDPEIAERLNPDSEKFHPYSLGSTNLDDAARYFGVQYFSKQWVTDHENMAFSENEEEKKMYGQVRAAYDNQVKAESEFDELMAFINKKAKWYSDPQDIMKKIDWNKYPTLAAMDRSIGQNGNLATGDLVALTEGLKYRYSDLEKYVGDLCEAKSSVMQDIDVYKYVSEGASKIFDQIDKINNTSASAEKKEQTIKAVEPVLTDDAIEVAKTYDKKLKEDAEQTEDVNTYAEQTANNTQLSTLYNPIKEMFDKIRATGDQIKTAVGEFYGATEKSNISNYSGTVLKNFDMISTFQQNEKKIAELEDAKIEQRAALESIVNGNDMGLSVYDASIANFQDQPSWNYLSVDSREKLSALEAQGKTEDAEFLYNYYVMLDSGAYEDLPPEQKKIFEEYRRTTENLDAAMNTKASGQAEYDKAMKEMDIAKKNQEAAISMMKKAGLDTKKMEDASKVTNFFLNFTNYSPTDWQSYNFYHEYSKMFMAGAENKDEMFKIAETGDAEIQEAIDVAKTLLEYADENGMTVPDNVRENVQRYIDAMERQHQDFEYLSKMNSADFSEQVEKGRQMAADMYEFDWDAYNKDPRLEAQPMWNLLSEEQKQSLLQNMEVYDINDIANQFTTYMNDMDIETRFFGPYRMRDLLTDYEADTFYYLLATEGLEGAMAYEDHLTDGSYGVLNSRAADKTEQSADDLASKGFLGRAAANVLSMLLSPVAAVGSAIYLADYGIKKLSGQRVEFNPNNVNLTANIYKKEAREKINEEIIKTYGEGTILQQFMSGLQEIISNRGDSIVNAITFGPLFGGISNGILQEFMSAVPMALTAATDAVADAKEKGASDTDLMGIFATTLLFEAGTEAVTLDSIKKALKIGEDLTTDGLKDVVREWLTRSGINEMVGETVTEFAEQLADTISLGENSDYARAIEKYKAEGMSEPEAKAKASEDQIKSLLHTALISYLSPGMDIASYGYGRFNSYKRIAQFRQENDLGDDSVLDVYREYKEMKRRENNPAEEIAASAQEAGTAAPALNARVADQQALDAAKQSAAEQTAQAEARAQADAEQRRADQMTLDYEIIQTARTADTASQTASIASVLDTAGTPESADMANAAAANMTDLFGDGMTPAEGMDNLITGAFAGDVDYESVKQAVMTAALSKDSAAYQMMQSEEYQNADPAERAQMLASTVEEDANNDAVQKQVSKAVYENRVARAEQQAALSPEVEQKQNTAKKAQAKLLDAEDALFTALETYNELLGAVDEARKDLQTISAEFQQNPTDNNLKQSDDAVSRLQSASEAAQNYKETNLDPTSDAVDKAQEEVDQAVEDVATAKREAAMRIVAEENQQRAVAERDAKIAEFEQKKQQELDRIRQEQDDNAHTADVEDFIARTEEQNGPLSEEEKQRIRDNFDTVRTEDAQQQQTVPEQTTAEQPAQQQENAGQNPETDEFGRLDDESARKRQKFFNEVSRRFNIKMDVVDSMKISEEEGTIDQRTGKGLYFNGRYDKKNNRILIDGNVTQNDVMYFVLAHELTHVAEAAGTYRQLANSVLRMAYGEDADYETIIQNLEKNNGKPTTKMEADLLEGWKNRYERATGTKMEYGDALQEMVADYMGTLFKGEDAKRQDLINRLVAEDPSVAKRFMNSVKSFIKKSVGMKGAWQTNAQKTVDMFEAALSKAQKGKTAEQKAPNYTVRKSGYSNNPVVRFDGAPSEGVNMALRQLGMVPYKDSKGNWGWRIGRGNKISEAQIQYTIKKAMQADALSGTGTAENGKRYSLDLETVKQYDDAVARGDMEAAQEDVDFAADNAMKNSKVRDEDGNLMAVYHGTSEQFTQFDMSKGRSTMDIQGSFFSPWEIEAGGYGENVGRYYLNIQNPAPEDVAYAALNRYKGQNEAGKKAREYLISQGYDGVANYDEFIAFYPEQIKSADPVTYDDNGNVIPLNERFTDNKDIRYSLSMEGVAVPVVRDDDGEPVASELPGGTITLDTGTKYSLNSFTPEEQTRVRQALLDKKGPDGKPEFTEEQVDKYMTDALSIASMIAADRTRLDFKANPVQKFLKPNNDYYYTLDASTLCAKRLLYQGTFDYVQHALPDEVFTPEDLIDLVNIMNEMGYETPCGICYVESRRRWLDTYAQQFLDTLPEEGRPSLDQLTTSDGLEKLRKDDPDMYKAFVDAMNSKGSANPKVVQLRTEYNGDIGKLTAKDIQKVKDIGGLRIQSFSDFETPHLLDMVQAVMDMASVGLTSQAYTKVPNFAWVFGDTGIKINLSLIGKGTGLDENGNLVFDNVEGMNFDEAMKLRNRYSKNVGTILVGINDEHIIAAMGDDRIDFIIPFHKSGWSAEELRKMPTLNNYLDYTASQNERLIIGERANKVKTIKNLGPKAVDNWIAREGEEHPGYEIIEQDNGKFTISYKNGYQTESFQKHLERTKEKLSNFEPVGANQYWEFDKSGEWNARKYLKMCADAGRIPKFSQFLIDNGDGSFSLPEGDDKRSTAIRKGYWKTLIDFKMYDNEGNGAEQTAVTPNINMDQAQRVLDEYKLGRQMPDRNDGTKGAFLPMESNNDVPVAVPAAEEYIERIKQKRQGNKPKGPDDTLEATPEIVVAQKGPSPFRTNPEDLQGMQNSGTAAMASGADTVLGNTETEGEETAASNQNAMAVDAETGETVNYRYSLPSDAPYMAAVERGEMDEAQRMVEEKAREAGYTIKAYHGTSTGGFTQFDSSRRSHGKSLGNGIYYTDSRSAAEVFTMPSGRETGDINKMVYESYLNLGDNPYIIDVDQMREENGDKPSLIRYLIDEAVKNTPDDATSTVVKGIYDGSDEKSTVYVLKDSSQIKSADTVTYDENGNVIPLSERFQKNNPDIRYSLPSDDILQQQIREYMANGGSLAPKTPGTAPQNPNNGYRQWGNEMAQESDELDEKAKQYVLNSEYAKDTNAAELSRALKWVRDNKQYATDDGYQESLRKVTSSRFNYRTKDGQARMIAVMGLAVARSDVNAQVQLADAYNKQGTDLGQALQARKLFRLMTPQGRVATLQRMLGNVNDQLEERGVKPIQLSDWIIQAASEATEEGEFAKIQQAAAAEIGEQIPANWKDKMRGLRMLSMLGNPRTHVRNFLGNMFFAPVVSLKNKLGAVAEIATHQEERTKTLAVKLNKDIADFAKEDAEFMRGELTGESKYTEGTMIQRATKPFKGFLQALMDFNSNALENEDWFFLKGHYRRALGGWIQANGYTVDQLKSNPELLEKGRAYAINEAQKATYRDFNGVAAKLNQLSRDPQTTGQKVLGFAVDAVLPFKKTPANILKRGLEYSPAGLVRGLKNAMLDVRSGKITPTQAIDRICSGLAGTAIMAMGYFLANAGCVSVGLDDDEDKLEKEQGNQKYAVRIKLFGQDITYTMDWAAPMSMPFFVGAAIREQTDKEGEFDVNEVLSALGNIAEPVLNLSMLDGVNTLFKTSQYDDTDTITQIGGKIASNYVTSYVPSLIGAITRTFADDTRRATYVKSGEGKGLPGTFRYAWEQTENKIPGLSRTNIPVRDVFGNPETSSFAERLIENFISPGYISNYKNDPILKEMDRLYVANVTDSEDMIPKDPPKTVKYNNQQYKLTAEQWDKYKEVRGKTAHSMLTKLINSADYKRADSATQIQMIKKCWDYADQVGKKEIIPDYDIGNMVTVEDITKEGKITSYTTKMITSLEVGDVVGYETMVEALREQEVEDKDIKAKIANKYRDKYKEAYRKNQPNEMARIEEILDMTDFDFDLESWEEQVDEKYGNSGSLFREIGRIASAGMSDSSSMASTSAQPSRPASDSGWDQYMNDLDDYWAGYDFSGNDPVGQYGQGNIDLNNRQIVQNDDGSISTERSFSFYDERTGKEVLIPLVVDGRVLTEEEAIDRYYETGEYLSMFDDWHDADEYAMMLHNRQDWFYNR